MAVPTIAAFTVASMSGVDVGGGGESHPANTSARRVRAVSAGTRRAVSEKHLIHKLRVYSPMHDHRVIFLPIPTTLL